MNSADSTARESVLEPDGTWYCGGCFSFNRRGAVRCYSCQGPSPVVVARQIARQSTRQTTARAPRVNSLFVVGVIALIFSSVVTLGLSGKLPISPVTPKAPAVAVASASATEDVNPAIDVSPSESPTMEPTAAPTDTPTPTVAPTDTPIPTLPPTPAPPTTVKLPTFPVNISGINLDFYTITGSDANTLIAAIESKGPASCGIGDAAACFRPVFTWSYQGSVDAKTGTCTVTSAKVSAVYTITLPQWVGPARVPAGLVDWWKLVQGHIVWHESQHLAIARDYVPKFQAALMAGSCDRTAEGNAVAAVEAKLEAAQKAFDASDHYTWPPYKG